MKRLISILIILSLVLCTFPVFIPVSAASTQGEYFDVLDFTGVNDTLDTSFDLNGSKVISFNLSTFLGSFPVYGFELTFSYTGAQPSISSFRLNNGSYSVTTSLVTPGLVRVRGDLGGDTGDSFAITFSSSSLSSVCLHSFDVYTTGFSSSAISGMMIAGNTQVAFNGSAASTINPSYGTFLQIRSDWWRNYDYIDIYLTLSALGINSISAFLQESSSNLKYSIPYEINYLNTFFDSTSLRDYEVQIRLDLTGLDHSLPDSILRLEFQLDWTSSSTLACTINSCRGFVFTDPVNVDAKWHQVLFNNLSNWFLYVVSAIGNLDQTITNSFDSWFAQLGGWLSSMTEEIVNKIDEVFDSSVLDESQSELDSGIDNFESSMQEEDVLFDDLSGTISSSNSLISETFSSYYEYISSSSVWGSILAFSWKPFAEVSSLMLIFLGCCIVINVVLIKR